ncbi:MAG: UDP-N-acetylmuramoyl-L-alanine--D-glutamate ligase [Pseudomonadota bacterium]|nr:UDP-N-acetylmuramoyl-L-alanine--D-glutamate ligase [Pseudomonadota bacterium]
MSRSCSVAGRNALVLGLGLTGFSMARYLHEHEAHVRVIDTRAAPPFLGSLRKELPKVGFTAGELAADDVVGVDVIAISPGVPKDNPVIAAAVARGVELVGDVELFARALPAGQKVIAITGSNGKTTVTSLVGALCAAARLSASVAGNIGEPVLDVLRGLGGGDWPDVFVLELSSFQLETTFSLAPLAATVLNVTENHLDRYADMDSYAAAKARIFTRGSVQVLNRDDPRSLSMRLPGRVVETFGAGMPALEEEWGLVHRADGVTWLARGGQLLLPTSDLKLVGRHNALNALAALALVSTVAPVKKRVLGALAAFEGLPHRVQQVLEAGGVLFVNDSKGTTVAATSVALQGLGRPVVLIAGGDGKGQDFAPLRGIVNDHCRAVLLIGRDAQAMAQAFEGTQARIEIADTLDRAVERAMDLARDGDAVVLSPACASLDQFPNYVARGERFMQLVRERNGEALNA